MASSAQCTSSTTSRDLQAGEQFVQGAEQPVPGRRASSAGSGAAAVRTTIRGTAAAAPGQAAQPQLAGLPVACLMASTIGLSVHGSPERRAGGHHALCAPRG